MMLVRHALYVRGEEIPPYVGDWQLLSHQRYPDAEFDWEDAQVIEAEAKIGEALTLDETLLIEQMIREKVAEEGGGSLETLIYSRLERLATGRAQMNYRIMHAAHGSPIVWAALIAYIASHWASILVFLGIAAVTVAAITFAIKSSVVIWKAGDTLEELLPAIVPVAVGLGLGLLLLLALGAFGRKKKT